MLLLNHPPPPSKNLPQANILAAAHALSDSPSIFFTTNSVQDRDLEEQCIGMQLLESHTARRAVFYLLRSNLGRLPYSIITSDELAMQQLTAAQLFAEARNEYSKQQDYKKDLISYYLAAKAAIRCQGELPNYLGDMTAEFAKTVAYRAESMAKASLAQGDLEGCLTMLTIAFSAYEDNTVPLDEPENELYGEMTVRVLAHLHEYQKVLISNLNMIGAAIAQRTMLNLARYHPAEYLLVWLEEILVKAPGRAATTFLQAAAAEDKRGRKHKSAWWWTHAAELLSGTQNLENWQRTFLPIANIEAVKRLGELAVKERSRQKDYERYCLYSAACSRNLSASNVVDGTWLNAFKHEEIVGLGNSVSSEMLSNNPRRGIINRMLLCFFWLKLVDQARQKSVSKVNVVKHCLRLVLDMDSKSTESRRLS